MIPQILRIIAIMNIGGLKMTSGKQWELDSGDYCRCP